MSEAWNFYFCQVDDKPASIFVDMGIADEAPVAGFTQRAYLSVLMRNPRDDGLSSQEEYDKLGELEDAVKDRLAGEDVLYVGRNTCGGSRDFYCYTKPGVEWDARAAAVMRAFPDYRFETGRCDEPDWVAYFEFLYPNDEGRDFMSNREVCDALERNGDALTQPREIEHWAYFPDERAREAFAGKASALGFEVRERYAPEGEENPYGIRLSRTDTPSHRDIHDVTVPLLRAARDCGGRYDGWESVVVK